MGLTGDTVHPSSPALETPTVSSPAGLKQLRLSSDITLCRPTLKELYFLCAKLCIH